MLLLIVNNCGSGGAGMMKRESGATMVEYVLMVSLIAIALIAAIVLFQGGVSNRIEGSVDCMESIADGAVNCPGVGGDE